VAKERDPPTAKISWVDLWAKTALGDGQETAGVVPRPSVPVYPQGENERNGGTGRFSKSTKQGSVFQNKRGKGVRISPGLFSVDGRTEGRVKKSPGTQNTRGAVRSRRPAAGGNNRKTHRWEEEVVIRKGCWEVSPNFGGWRGGKGGMDENGESGAHLWKLAPWG